MIADWTAVSVRARGLAGRRLGRGGIRTLAATHSLAEAVTVLSHTAYRHDVQPTMDLAAVEHAVSSTLLWHLRVLAGWAPSAGLERIRILAGGFEIANILGLLAHLEGRAKAAPYELGALATVWTTLSPALSKEDVRTRLTASAWGDPGTSGLAETAVALQVAWARRIASGVPEAGSWAKILAGILKARMLAADGPPPTGSVIDRNLRHILGGRWTEKTKLKNEDLWQAEARAWGAIEERALQMQVGWRPGPAVVIAVAGLLAVDAWRTRAALEMAARGGVAPDEVLNVVA